MLKLSVLVLVVSWPFSWAIRFFWSQRSRASATTSWSVIGQSLVREEVAIVAEHDLIAPLDREVLPERDDPVALLALGRPVREAHVFVGLAQYLVASRAHDGVFHVGRLGSAWTS